MSCEVSFKLTHMFKNCVDVCMHACLMCVHVCVCEHAHVRVHITHTHTHTHMPAIIVLMRAKT